MNKRLLLTIIILLTFVIFGLQRSRNKNADQQSQASENLLNSDSDYYISEMILDRFLPDGTNYYRIKAERVTHFPEGDISVLQLPELNWQDSSKPGWRLTALSGILRRDLLSNEDSLLLKGQVLAKKDDNSGKPFTIKTESLLVLPGSQELNTEDRVFLEGYKFHESGTGMHAQLSHDQINLLADVKGQYD